MKDVGCDDPVETDRTLHGDPFSSGGLAVGLSRSPGGGVGGSQQLSRGWLACQESVSSRLFL